MANIQELAIASANKEQSPLSKKIMYYVGTFMMIVGVCFLYSALNPTPRAEQINDCYNSNVSGVWEPSDKSGFKYLPYNGGAVAMAQDISEDAFIEKPMQGHIFPMTVLACDDEFVILQTGTGTTTMLRGDSGWSSAHVTIVSKTGNRSSARMDKLNRWLW